MQLSYTLITIYMLDHTWRQSGRIFPIVKHNPGMLWQHWPVHHHIICGVLTWKNRCSAMCLLNTELTSTIIFLILSIIFVTLYFNSCNNNSKCSYCLSFLLLQNESNTAYITIFIITVWEIKLRLFCRYKPLLIIVCKSNIVFWWICWKTRDIQLLSTTNIKHKLIWLVFKTL